MIAVIPTQLTTPESRSVSLFIGGRDFTKHTKWDRLRITDSGGAAAGRADLHIELSLADAPEIRDQTAVRMVDHTAGEEAYYGVVVSRNPSLVPQYTAVDVVADDIGSLLDTAYIPTETRPAETLPARIGYLWGKYAGSFLSGDLTHVTAGGATLPAHHFIGVTLRQAIEQTIAQSTVDAGYHVDATGRLHVFESEGFTAPYNISASPGALTNSATRTQISAGGAYRAFPGLAELPDGRLLTVYRSGTDHASTQDGVVVMRTSSDGGASWSGETTVYDSTTLDVRDPNVVLLGSTLLVTLFTWDGASTYVIRTTTSSDWGRTWSPPAIVTDAFTSTRAVTGAVVELSNGDLLMPIYGRNTSDSFDTAAILRSTDDGATWGSQVTIGGGPADLRHYQEPCLVVLSDGTVAALMRSDTSETIWRSASSDNGATWSAPTDEFSGGGRPSPLLLTSGSLVCFYRSKGPGAKAVYRVSMDDGVTWGSEQALDSASGVMEYGWAVQLATGSVVAVYALESSGTVSDMFARRLLAEIAPQNLLIDYDASNFANRVYVQGGTPTGSGFFQDDDAIAAANGLVRTATVNAPECETAALAQTLASLYLGRVSMAVPRGSFETASPADGWRAGQNLTVTSADHGLSALAQRISRVTTRILRPGANLLRAYHVEIGGAGGGGRGISSSLGLGQLVRVPFNFGGQAVLDSDEAANFFVSISDRINVIAEAKVWVRLREFWAPARSASSSGDLTSTSGGGSTSGSGGSSTPTSSGGGGHNHQMFEFIDNTPPALTARHFQVQGPGGPDIELKTSAQIDLSSASTSDHTHTVTIAAHDHSTPSHQHTTPGHTHDLAYGIFKETIPASWSVTMRVYQLDDDGTTWNLVETVSGLTGETHELDLADSITASGLWRLEFQSAAAQPNNGRLAIDVAGQVMGAIASI